MATKILKKTLGLVLANFLIFSISGVSNTLIAIAHASDAPITRELVVNLIEKSGVEISKILVKSNERIIRPLLETKAALRAFQDLPSDENKTLAKSAIRNLYAAAVDFKNDLVSLGSLDLAVGLNFELEKKKDGSSNPETLGGKLAQNTRTFYVLYQSYSEIAQVLRAAPVIFGKDETPLSQMELGNLSLIFSKSAVDVITSFSAGDRDEKSTYDLPFDVRRLDDGRYWVGPNAYESLKPTQAGLIAFPTSKVALDVVRTTALKSIFLREEATNILLYSDEKIDVRLSPNNYDTAILSLQDHAHSLTTEVSYRAYLSKNIVSNVVQKFSVSIEKQQAVVSQFLSELQKEFPTQILESASVEEIVANEQKVRGQAFQIALQRAPGLLSKMSREELRFYLSSTIEAQYSIFFKMIMSGVLSKDIKLTAFQANWLASLSLTAARAYLGGPNNFISDEMLDAFMRTRNDGDYMTSFQRYDFAARLLAVSDELQAFKKGLKKLEKAGDKVSSALVPSRVDTAIALSALKSNDQMPDWLLEVVQGAGAKVEKLKTDVERFNLLTAVNSMPKLMAGYASLAHIYASDGAIGSLNAIHQDLLATRATYRWAPIDSKLDQLRALAVGDASNFLKTVTQMLRVADLADAPSLRRMIEDSLDMSLHFKLKYSELLKEEVGQGSVYRFFGSKWNTGKTLYYGIFSDSKEYWQSLVDTFKKGDKYLLAEGIFITDLFGSSEKRTQALRKKLTITEILRGYYLARIANLYRAAPILKNKLFLHSSLQKSLAEPNEVPLETVAAGISNAVRLSFADSALLENSFDALTGKNPREEGLLQQPASTPLKPMTLVNGALGGKRKNQEFWLNVLDTAVDGNEAFCKTFAKDKSLSAQLLGPNPLLVSAVCSNHAPMDRNAPFADSYWPKQFKVRDVLPAYFDEKNSTYERTRRVVLSALLTPYLKSAVTASVIEQRYLLDLSYDNTDMLANSEAFAEASKEYSGAIGTGMAEIQNTTNQWRSTFEEIKNATMHTQEWAGYIFNFSLLVDLTPMGHTITGGFMFVSAVFDWIADAGMFVEYAARYRNSVAFSHGTGNGSNSTVSAEMISSMHEEMAQRLEGLVDRTPGDIIFFWGMGKNIVLNGLSLERSRAHKTARIARAKEANVDLKHFDYDFAKYGAAMHEVGLPASGVPPRLILDAMIAKGEQGPVVVREEMLRLMAKLGLIAKFRGAETPQLDFNTRFVLKAELKDWKNLWKAAAKLQKNYGPILDITFDVKALPDSTNLYEVLGVERKATRKQIQAAFYERVKGLTAEFENAATTEARKDELKQQYRSYESAYDTLVNRFARMDLNQRLDEAKK